MEFLHAAGLGLGAAYAEALSQSVTVHGVPKGSWVGDREMVFEKIMPTGTPLGRIYDLYGKITAEVLAPEEGLVFGLRSRPSVLEGEWCCFYGIIDEVRTDLIP